tara:strand:+ start:278 stop:505 length:228 start_codon:yes stop_codon:yes gene_type:complete
MQKNYFHNYKSTEEMKIKKNFYHFQYIKKKSNVDINKLLNRVRLDEKNEIKRKAIFFISVFLAIGLFGIFLSFIN